MDDYLKNIIELNNASANRDLVKYINALDMTSNSLAKLVNSLYESKVKIENHHSELEGKYFRFIMANHSIIKLCGGLKFKLLDRDIAQLDIFSIKSIMRYLIESYLVMFYLFFDESTSELNLRYDIYKLHALNKQISFSKKSDYAKTKSKEVEKEIKALKQKIISSEAYLNTNENTKKKLIYPIKAILKDRKKLFEDSGLNKSRISDMWSIYSNLAHSEHISDRQFNTFYKLKTSDLKSDLVLTIEICLILNTRSAIMLTKQFNCCEKKFNRLSPKEKAVINLWGKLH